MSVIFVLGPGGSQPTQTNHPIAGYVGMLPPQDPNRLCKSLARLSEGGRYVSVPAAQRTIPEAHSRSTPPSASPGAARASPGDVTGKQSCARRAGAGRRHTGRFVMANARPYNKPMCREAAVFPGRRMTQNTFSRVSQKHFFDFLTG